MAISYILVAGDVQFSLRNTTYQNNSLVTLEHIGENDDAILCITNLTACCRSGDGLPVLGQWFFPNTTGVYSSSYNSDLYKDRGQMVVRMKRRKGGINGIYHCEIPDSINVTQTIYIGVYTASTGK